MPIWNYTTGGRDSHEHFAYIDASNTSAAFTGPNDDAGFWSIRTVASRGPGAGLSVGATPCSSETRGLMPLAPVGCHSRVDGGATTISWTPADGDAADRYVIYARSADENSIRWVTSVEADEASYTHDDFADPSSYAWLVKTRTTSADGKRYFTDGVLCAGSSVEYIPGDTRAKAVRLAGGAERFSGSLINASLEPGEQAVTFPSDGPCRAHRDATGRTVGSLTGSVWAELEMASTNATAYEFELSAPWGAQVAVYAAPVGGSALRQLGCSALTSWNSDGAKVNVNLEAGGRYLVQIFGQSWPSGVSDPTHAGPSGQWSAPGTGAFTLSLRPV